MESDDLWLEYTISGQGKELGNASLAVLSRSYPGRTFAAYSRLIEYTPSLGEHRYVPVFGYPGEYFLTFNPEATPYDSYDSPKLVIGTNEEVSFFDVSLTYELPSGYTASVRELRRMTFDELIRTSAHIDNRLPASIKESVLGKHTHFLYVDFVIVRSFNQIILLTAYFLSASYILYTCSILAISRIPRIEDRLGIFAGAGVALFAFVWGFRQMLPGRVTYWEAILLLALVAWGLLELHRGTTRDMTQTLGKAERSTVPTTRDMAQTVGQADWSTALDEPPKARDELALRLLYDADVKKMLAYVAGGISSFTLQMTLFYFVAGKTLTRPPELLGLLGLGLWIAVCYFVIMTGTKYITIRQLENELGLTELMWRLSSDWNRLSKLVYWTHIEAMGIRTKNYRRLALMVDVGTIFVIIVSAGILVALELGLLSS